MIVISPYPDNHLVLLNFFNYKTICVNKNHIVHHVENFILFYCVSEILNPPLKNCEGGFDAKDSI